MAEDLFARLQAALGLDRSSVVPLEQAETLALQSRPELIVLLLAESEADSALRAIPALAEIGRVVAVGPATDPKLILRAVQAGAELFLDQDNLDEELEAAFARFRVRRAAVDRPSQVIAVLSAAGGSGSSTVAINLAAILAREHGTANLIDLDAGKSDLASLLDLNPTYSLADLCRNDDRLDRSLYEKLLTRHASGIGLLAAPGKYEDAESLTVQGVDRALGLAQELFADVVVDLAGARRPEHLMALRHATRIFIVTRLDFLSIRNTRRMLDFFIAHDLPMDRVEVVVNQCDLPHQLPLDEAEDAIGCALTNRIPHDGATIQSASNLGVPAATAHPHSPVVRALTKLAGLALPAPPRVPLYVRWPAEATAWWRESAYPWLKALRARRSAPAEAIPESLPESEGLKIRHEPVHAAQPCAVTRAISA